MSTATARPFDGAANAASTAPHKVLFVESGRGYGGSAFSLFRLVKSLDATRYVPHVVVYHEAEPFARIRSLGVPVRVLPSVRPFAGPSRAARGLLARARNYWSVYGNLGLDIVCNGIRLVRYIRRNQIDLVHLNNGIFENLPAVVAARLAGIPCVSHLRGTEELMRLEKRCAPWIAAVITLNRTMFDHYLPVFGKEKVRLICNGVDLDAFQNPDPGRVRREFGLSPGTFSVGTFARLVEGKGIPEFIATASRVARQHGQCRFFVIGDDASEARAFERAMRRLADDAGLGDRLVFTGWRDDRLDIMAAMDLVLQISTTFPEGMSLAPLEAMALGKPVIVTRIPGYEFSIDDGKSGFVVAPGDVEALAQKILLLAQNRELAQSLGRESHRKAVREFDVCLTARRVEALYDEVLQHREGQDSGRSRKRSLDSPSPRVGSVRGSVADRS